MRALGPAIPKDFCRQRRRRARSERTPWEKAGGTFVRSGDFHSLRRRYWVCGGFVFERPALRCSAGGGEGHAAAPEDAARKANGRAAQRKCPRIDGPGRLRRRFPVCGPAPVHGGGGDFPHREPVRRAEPALEAYGGCCGVRVRGKWERGMQTDAFGSSRTRGI